MGHAVEEVEPGLHVYLTPGLGCVGAFQHQLVQMLTVHTHGHFVNRRHVDALYHGVGSDVAEPRNLAAHIGVDVLLGAQYQDVGLNA